MYVFIVSKVTHLGVSVNSVVGVYSEKHKAMKVLNATKSVKVSDAQWMVSIGDDKYTITKHTVC